MAFHYIIVLDNLNKIIPLALGSRRSLHSLAACKEKLGFFLWKMQMLGTMCSSMRVTPFRNLKSDLGLRPIYHQKERRVDAHIFISVLAYHALHDAIKRKLVTFKKADLE